MVVEAGHVAPTMRAALPNDSRGGWDARARGGKQSCGERSLCGRFSAVPLDRAEEVVHPALRVGLASTLPRWVKLTPILGIAAGRCMSMRLTSRQ